MLGMVVHTLTGFLERPGLPLPSLVYTLIPALEWLKEENLHELQVSQGYTVRTKKQNPYYLS